MGVYNCTTMIKIGEKIFEKSFALLPKMNVSQIVPHQVATIPPAVTDFEIIVHAMEIGVGTLGHVDICMDGFVYSYGNYDETTCKMNGAFGEGVLLKAPRNAYFEFCKTHYQKTLYVYSLKVTQEQKAKVIQRLEKMLKYTSEWFPTNEICSLNPVSGNLEEMYAYFMAKAMPVTFYKFKKTRFESYTAWRHNCLLFVDNLAACLGVRYLRARLTTFPSLYYERLEQFKEQKESIIVDCAVY